MFGFLRQSQRIDALAKRLDLVILFRIKRMLDVRQDLHLEKHACPHRPQEPVLTADALLKAKFEALPTSVHYPFTKLVAATFRLVSARIVPYQRHVADWSRLRCLKTRIR